MKRQAWEIISLSNHIDRVMQQGVMIKSKTSKNLLTPNEVNQVNMSKDNLEPLNFSELMDESNSQMNESNRDSAKSTTIDDDDAFEEAMKTVKDKVERLVQIGKEMARKTAVLERKVENLEDGRLTPHDI